MNKPLYNYINKTHNKILFTLVQIKIINTKFFLIYWFMSIDEKIFSIEVNRAVKKF